MLVNVLERLADDGLALRQARDRVRPGGTVLVYAPAHRALYSGFDAASGRRRRYSAAQLAQLARRSGLAVSELRYVDPVGALAWLVAVRGLGRPPGTAAAGADRRMPSRRRAVEGRGRAPFGRSLFMAAQRPLTDR